MTDLVGKRLGEFEVVRELGRGGMGVVFEAMQTSLNRRVALKVLGPGLGLTAKAVGRFRREAEAAAKLHHTNIVPVYATGEEGGFHFYAMELIDGPSLDRVIAELRNTSGGAKPTPTLAPELTTTGPYLDTSTPTGSGVSSGLSSGSGYFDTVARLVADVAEALHHAHQNNVIHRDIKPGNLLLGSDGRLNVTDFGLARALEEPGMTTTGEFVGTPAYMAPEQIAGGRIPVDHRCDIYSLGATLYELLTLRPPFIADRRDQLLAMVVQKEPPAPRRVNPKVPRDLETICLKCLEKDPDRRYHSGKELADDLRRYINRFAIQAKRAGLLTKAKKWVRRNPALTGAGLAVVLLALGAAGVFAWQSHRNEKLRLAAKEQHEQELREEKLHAAMDRAILASMRDDRAEAERAITEAEQHGAAIGQVQLLRGQVAYNRGDGEGALLHLRLAYQLMPESITARCLLAEAEYELASSVLEFNRLSADAERLVPVTPEDFLYLGRFVALDAPERGLLLIDAGLRRRESPVGRLLRCKVLLAKTSDTVDVADVTRAVEAASVARTLLPDNPQALIASLSAARFEELAHAEVGDLVRAKEASKHAERFAAELGVRFPNYPPAVRARLSFLVAMHSPDAELLVTSARDIVPRAYALLLAGKGRAAEAVPFYAARINRSNSTSPSLLLGLFQAEAGDRAGAYETYRAGAVQLGNANDSISPMILFLLGRREEAVAVYRGLCVAARKEPMMGNTWELRRFEFIAGDLSEVALLREAGKGRWNWILAHMTIGWVRLSEGDREAARFHFRLLKSASEDEDWWCGIAHWCLARLDADPNWPPWIPHLAPMPHEVKRP